MDSKTWSQQVPGLLRTSHGPASLDDSSSPYRGLLASCGCSCGPSASHLNVLLSVSQPVSHTGLLAVLGHSGHCLPWGLSIALLLSGTFCPVQGTPLTSEPLRVCGLLCGGLCPSIFKLNHCPKPALHYAPFLGLIFPHSTVTTNKE